MWRLARANLRAGITALLPAGISIMLATAFLAVAMLSAPLISTAALRMYALDYGRADVVVESVAGPLTQQTVDELAALPLVTDTALDVTGTIGIRQGDRVVHEVFVPAQDSTFARYHLLEGYDPSHRGEIALTQRQAATFGVGIGDELTLSLPVAAGAALTAETGDREALACSGEECTFQPTVTVTGIIQSPPTVLGDSERVVISADDISAFYALGALPQQVDRVLVAIPDPNALIEAIAAEFPDEITAETVAAASQERLDYTTGQTSLLPAIILVFAALAMVVAALVVANTFQVLVAQRIRILALVRCVGAKPAQLRGAVMIEAAVLGLIGGIAGILLGYGLISAALAYLANLPAITNFEMALPRNPAAILAPVFAAVAMSILASIWPAIIASKVPPLQALALADLPADRRAATWRTQVGLGLIVGGVGGLGISLLIQPWLAPIAEAFPLLQVALVVACIFVAAIVAGLAVLAPRLLPYIAQRLARGLAALLPRTSRVPLNLTSSGITRHPARVAATTMALFLTTALVTMTAVGTSLSRASMNSTLDDLFLFDLEVSAYGQHDREAATFLRSHVAAIPGVTDVAIGQVTELAVSYGSEDERTTVSAAGVDPLEVALTAHHSDIAPALRDDTIVLSSDYGIPRDVTEVTVWVPRPVEVPASAEEGTFGTSPSQEDPLGLGSPPAEAKKLRVIHTDAWSPALLTTATFASLDPESTSLVALASLDPAMARQATDTARTTFAPMSANATFVLEGSQIVRGAVEQVLSVLFAVIVGLLAIAVIISFVGVTNTMTLSAVERRREVALLRAVGMTSAQLRRSLAAEGLLISVIGTVLGVLGGTLIGIVGAILVLTRSEIPLAFDFPIRTILVLIALSIPAGVLSSIIPAHTVLRDFNVDDLSG